VTTRLMRRRHVETRLQAPLLTTKAWAGRRGCKETRQPEISRAASRLLLFASSASSPPLTNVYQGESVMKWRRGHQSDYVEDRRGEDSRQRRPRLSVTVISALWRTLGPDGRLPTVSQPVADA
jgi:hypothetical protein